MILILFLNFVDSRKQRFSYHRIQPVVLQCLTAGCWVCSRGAHTNRFKELGQGAQACDFYDQFSLRRSHDDDQFTLYR